MTTFLIVEYVATDEFGIRIKDVLPVEELPDIPHWRYKILRPQKYKKVMKQRAEAIEVAMDRLLDLCQAFNYTELSASIKLDTL